MPSLCRLPSVLDLFRCDALDDRDRAHITSADLLAEVYRDVSHHTDCTQEASESAVLEASELVRRWHLAEVDDLIPLE